MYYDSSQTYNMTKNKSLALRVSKNFKYSLYDKWISSSFSYAFPSISVLAVAYLVSKVSVSIEEQWQLFFSSSYLVSRTKNKSIFRNHDNNKHQGRAMHIYICFLLLTVYLSLQSAIFHYIIVDYANILPMSIESNCFFPQISYD